MDRTKFYALQGRSRKQHFEIARRYGIDRIPYPSGGCVLTDPGFSYRLKHYLDNEKIKIPKVYLLRIGRHFFINETRLIIPRNERERRELRKTFSLIHNAILLETNKGFTALAYNVGNNIDEIIKVCSAYIREEEKIKIITKENEITEYDLIKNVDKIEVKKYMVVK